MMLGSVICHLLHALHPNSPPHPQQCGVPGEQMTCGGCGGVRAQEPLLQPVAGSVG